MQNLRELFARILREPVEKITDTISPKTSMSWNSLRHVELVTEIERTYNITFSTAEIIAMNSFANVREVIQRKGITIQQD